jgi:fumarate hydratase subunit beta
VKGTGDTELIRLVADGQLAEGAFRSLRAGDAVEISGELITTRDATAQLLSALIRAGKPLPVDLRGQVLYAAGPSPAKPGHVVGSAGPTTVDRISRFLPSLFAAGVRGIIGKGELHGPVVDAFVRYGAVYFAAVGGLGALLAQHITAAEVLSFPDLGPEAIYRFQVQDFPVVVVIDTTGQNLHETARSAWRREP